MLDKYIININTILLEKLNLHLSLKYIMVALESK